ncbi:hypothetical protein EUX98_g6018 [Antrodiella citrinella]|uniref:Nephrocystin 3-like N-terminal domain-containing protein n=1 Tax=Antrodiella citrinella TaxID=2447956 RepID=A0A4S4MXN4_9APHY|nr:hypothetical protein EUX98_g6018 [Antrodiella citrinella]
MADPAKQADPPTPSPDPVYFTHNVYTLQSSINDNATRKSRRDTASSAFMMKKNVMSISLDALDIWTTEEEILAMMDDQIRQRKAAASNDVDSAEAPPSSEVRHAQADDSSDLEVPSPSPDSSPVQEVGSDSASTSGRPVRATQSAPTQDKSNSRTKQNLTRLRSGVDATLEIAKVAGDSFPIAKGVVGGILLILKTVDRVKENANVLGKMIARLERFDQIISPDTGSASALQLWEDKDLQREIITDFQLDLQQASLKNVTDMADLAQLDKLPHSEDAAYEKERQMGKRTSCFEHTRVEIAGKLELWASSLHDFQLFWLNGMAGTGKSTIADSLYRYISSDNYLGAAFFCSRDTAQARDTHRIFPSIAYQLRSISRNTANFLSNSYPLMRLKKASTTILARPRVIIIDALDECSDEHGPPIALVELLLSRVPDFRKVGLKFFVSSRPSDGVPYVFEGMGERHASLDLHNEPLPAVAHDMHAFVEHSL